MINTNVPEPASDQPQSKTELLERMRAARARLEQVVAGLDSQALSAAGPEGWSVKDHLAHLAAWQRKVLGNLEGQTGYEVLGVPEAVYKSGDWVAINEFVRAPDKDRPAADILAEFRRVNQTIIQRVAGLSDDLLFGSDDSLLSNIAGNTYGHDDEHRPWIEAVLKHNQPAPQKQ